MLHYCIALQVIGNVVAVLIKIVQGNHRRHHLVCRQVVTLVAHHTLILSLLSTTATGTPVPLSTR